MAPPKMLKNLMLRVRQYPVAISAFGIALVCVLVISLRSSSLSSKTEVLNTKEEAWERITENLRNSVDLEGHVEGIASSSELIDSRLMMPTERALNDQYFYDLRELSGVRLSSLNENGVIDTESVKLPGVTEFKRFSLIDYRITVEGSFEQIVDFSTRLMTGRHFARVSAFSLVRVAESGVGMLSLNLQLQMLGSNDES